MSSNKNVDIKLNACFWNNLHQVHSKPKYFKSNKCNNILHIPVPTDAILGVETVDVVLGRIIDALLLPVMLTDVLTTGTVIDFCRTLGDDWPEDTSIT